MTLDERISLCIDVGNQLRIESDEMRRVLEETHQHNPWFDPVNVRESIHQIVIAYLNQDKLTEWVHRYAPIENAPKRVGLVMAGNIPLVGFHDVLSTFICGHYSKLRLSQKDIVLWPYIIRLFTDINPKCAPYFEIVERLNEIDAVIATGSDNAARYFHYYFDRYPHIIRKNRVGVAVLSGEEKESDLVALAKDVFQYYGLGCRNVATIWVPRDYDFVPLLRLWDRYSYLKDHNSYRNNFDYNLAIYIMNGVPYMANDAIMLVENDRLVSRLACVHFQYYDDIQGVIDTIKTREGEIQVVVSHNPLPGFKSLLPGTAQQPSLMDYADGVDTMNFLINL